MYGRVAQIILEPMVRYEFCNFEFERIFKRNQLSSQVQRVPLLAVAKCNTARHNVIWHSDMAT